jgi:hypothetical protein
MQNDPRPAPTVSRATLLKAFHSLIGIIEGIVIDGTVNEREIRVLREWASDFEPYRRLRPFNELLPLVEYVVNERSLSEDARQDILWSCEKLSSEVYLDRTSKDLQRLHALLGGIAADGIVTAEELTGLAGWLKEHDHLLNYWPYAEVTAIVNTVMADRRIDAEEQKAIQQFFAGFIPQQ